MRRRLPLLAAAALLAAPGGAEAAFTSSIQDAPPRATMLGDATVLDTTLIYVQAGLLTHNRKSMGDAGFASDSDFKTGDGATVSGRPQSTNLTVRAGGGFDFLFLDGPLSDFTGNVLLDGGAGSGDKLSLNDTEGGIGRSYTLRAEGLEGTGGGTITFTNVEELELRTSGGNDRIHAPSAVGAQTSLDTGDGDDTVVLGDGVNLGVRLLAGAGNDTFDATALAHPVVADLGTYEVFRAAATKTGANPDSGAPYTGEGLLAYQRATDTADLTLSTTATAAQLTGSRIGVAGRDEPDASAQTVLDTGADPYWACNPAPCSRELGGLGFGGRLADLRAGRIFFQVSGSGGNVRGAFEPAHHRGTASGLGAVTSLENVLGGSADDTLVGSGDANRLAGNAGDDTLSGTGGADALDGGAGADTLNGGDGDDAIATADGGTADWVVCGAGTDTVDADAADVVDPDCETVKRPAGPAGPPPPGPPGPPGPPEVIVRPPALTDATFASTFLQTRGGRPAKAGDRIAVARDGSALVLVVVCRSATPCRTEQRLFLGRTPADPFAARARPAPAASGALVVPPGEARTATIRLTSAGRRALARARQRRSAATLGLRTTDASGRRQQSTVGFTLAGAKPKPKRKARGRG